MGRAWVREWWNNIWGHKNFPKHNISCNLLLQAFILFALFFFLGRENGFKADIFGLKLVIPVFGAYWILTLRERKSNIKGLKSSIWNYCLPSHFHWNLVLKWLFEFNAFPVCNKSQYQTALCLQTTFVNILLLYTNSNTFCVDEYFCVLQVDCVQIEQMPVHQFLYGGQDESLGTSAIVSLLYFGKHRYIRYSEADGALSQSTSAP